MHRKFWKETHQRLPRNADLLAGATFALSFMFSWVVHVSTRTDCLYEKGDIGFLLAEPKGRTLYLNT